MEARFIGKGNLIKGKAAEVFVKLGLAEPLEEKVQKRVKLPSEPVRKPVKKRKKRKAIKK